jgi:hypothetical protein
MKLDEDQQTKGEGQEIFQIQIGFKIFSFHLSKQQVCYDSTF